jgi:Peptidase M50B-like
VDENEFNRCCADLELEKAGLTFDALERAYLKKNFALIRGGTPEERTRLRETCEKLSLHLKEQIPNPAPGRATSSSLEKDNPGSASRTVPVYQLPLRDRKDERHDPFSFDSQTVNIAALPLVVLIAWLVNLSPLVFFLRGFHIWVHEFGHATVAWLVGKRALPLPIGWTNVESENPPLFILGCSFS